SITAITINARRVARKNRTGKRMLAHQAPRRSRSSRPPRPIQGRPSTAPLGPEPSKRSTSPGSGRLLTRSGAAATAVSVGSVRALPARQGRSGSPLYLPQVATEEWRVQEMVIYGVSFDMVGKQPIVLLKAVESNKFLPIWIGHPEAAAILMKLQGA